MWLLIVLVIISAVLTGVFRRLALKYSLIDHPNQRSSHEVPTPRGGGISVILSFFFGTVFLWWQGLLSASIVWPVIACAGLVALVGLLDDHRHLSAGIRILVHAVSAVGIIYFLDNFPPLPWFGHEIRLGTTGYIVAAVSLVWLLNLYNFMDGIDGIAGIEAICVAGGAALIIRLNNGNPAHAFWLLTLATATLGFLFWNWPPAKIFMGDACS
jgi:Fuc2NAc and GlcNAc transferase